MFRLACQCVVCAAVIDHIISLDSVSEGKKVLKHSALNYKKYITHLVDLFPEDDIEVQEYGKKALSAVENLIKVPQIDWAKIHEQSIGAEAKLMQGRLYLQANRPEFIQELEESDLKAVRARYLKKPNLVALMEVLMAKEVPVGFENVSGLVEK